jgi:hypothetical protein
MEKMTQLMHERQILKEKLRLNEFELSQEIFNLPRPVLEAIAYDIVKFNFPLPQRIRQELGTFIK